MEAASKNLTPVTLELGGKNPCIVDREARIAQAARRITWGKLLNAGQSCLAPDYILVHRSVKDELVQALRRSIEEFFGTDPEKSPDFSRIVNDRHFNRLRELLKDGSVICGGAVDEKTRYIAPTLIENVSVEDRIMQEEIFGPLLPIIE